MNKFAHHGADDDHRWFSVLGEACFERLTPACPADRDHRGHVEGFSEKGMAHLRDSGLSADADARLVAIVADRLGHGKDVRLVEATLERAAPMAGSAETDPLRALAQIRLEGEVGGNQLRDID
ncbi:hypothetical protein LDFHOB_01575 [Candidatus Electronema aureum]